MASLTTHASRRGGKSVWTTKLMAVAAAMVGLALPCSGAEGDASATGVLSMGLEGAVYAATNHTHHQADPLLLSTFPASLTIRGNLVLILLYGVVIAGGAKALADGAEHLSETFENAAFIGGFVIPMLGALPDAAITLQAMLDPDAERQIEAAVGMLVGSSFMLIFLAWLSALLLGKCDIDPETGNIIEGVDTHSLTSRIGWTHSGVYIGGAVRTKAYFMLATSFVYLIVLVPGIATRAHYVSHHKNHYMLNICSLVGGCTCLLVFLLVSAYDAYKLCAGTTAPGEFQQVPVKDPSTPVIRSSSRSGRVAAVEEPALHPATSALKEQLLANSIQYSPFASAGPGGVTQPVLLKDQKPQHPHHSGPMANVLEGDEDGTTPYSEGTNLWADGMRHRTSHSVGDDEEGGAPGMSRSQSVGWFLNAIMPQQASSARVTVLSQAAIEAVVAADQTNDDDDAVSVRSARSARSARGRGALGECHSGLVHGVTTSSHWSCFRRFVVGSKGAVQISFGAFIICVFSDPMCTSLVALTDKDNDKRGGSHLPVSTLMVSFIVLPVVCSLGELLSTLLLARRKKTPTTTMAFAQLYGSTITNNTFCLGVLLIVLYLKDISWRYNSETFALVSLQVIVGVVGGRSRVVRLGYEGVAVLAASVACISIGFVLNHYIG